MTKPSVSVPLVLDSFNRADSSTSMGSTDGGSLGALAWTRIGTDGVYGISSNKAYASTPHTPSPRHIDAGVADGVLSLDITTGASGTIGGLAFRILDNANYVFARYNLNGANNAWELYKVVASAFTLLGSTTSAGIAASTTYRLEMTFRGSALTFKVDGVTKASATDSAHSTRTKHGLEGHVVGAAGGVRWDNFQIDP